MWDHAIELKKEFVPRKGKIYPLSREEKGDVCKFINEQLKKEYMYFRLLKLSQTALVCFVGKKDGKKRMVQDYRYLNKWTIKNNYTLPLISDIVENIDTKKVFNKLDLWQEYNIQIKEGDEWKVTFMTPEELFEPMVIFFKLINSLATFQIMMNKIL